MSFFIYLLTAIVAVLVYLNVVEHYKKGTELEIYEMDYDNHYGLQKICKKKQPVLFEMANRVMDSKNVLNRLSLETLAKKYGKEKIHISNMQDKSTIIKPVSLRLEKAVELIHSDTELPYLSCNNSEMVQETALQRYAESLDEYCKPSFTIQTERDFIFGSDGATTPLGYHENHSAYLYVAQGQITIKMTPLRNNRFLAKPFRKLGNRTVSLKTDLWKNNEDIPSLEFQVAKGWMLYIPPYWWYSIRIDDVATPSSTEGQFRSDTIVFTYHYTTVMNMAIKIPESIRDTINAKDIQLPPWMSSFIGIGNNDVPISEKAPHNSVTNTTGDDEDGYEEREKPVLQTVDVEQAFQHPVTE